MSKNEIMRNYEKEIFKNGNLTNIISIMRIIEIEILSYII